MAEKFWDRFNEADRVEFARYLSPLVIASRDKKFSKAEASVYLLTLQDVPRDVLALAVTKLVQDGVTWMPKPGAIKSACCDVVEERRRALTAEAAVIREQCELRKQGACDGIHRDTHNGVVRCECHKQAVQLIASAGEPLTRPALPPASDEVLA